MLKDGVSYRYFHAVVAERERNLLIPIFSGKFGNFLPLEERHLWYSGLYCHPCEKPSIVDSWQISDEITAGCSCSSAHRCLCFGPEFPGQIYWNPPSPLCLPGQPQPERFYNKTSPTVSAKPDVLVSQFSGFYQWGRKVFPWNFFFQRLPRKEPCSVCGGGVLSYFDTDNNSWRESSTRYPRHILPPSGHNTLMAEH